MGADALPAERADALARLWCLTPEQRERFDVALNSLAQVGGSCRAARVAVRSRRGAVLFRWAARTRTSPATVHMPKAPSMHWRRTRPIRRALVIDYKTGGTPDETPEQLLEKHALQARV